jgi:hypothetical protein
MEWSGRALTLPASNDGMGDERSTAMSSKSSSAVTTMGIDIGKNTFHLIGLDERGAIVLRSEMVTWSA